MKTRYQVALLFAAALVIALLHISQRTAPPFFYQTYFEPAVMIACGKGLSADRDAQPPKLTDFLNLKTQTFSCEDLPQEQNLNTHLITRTWFYMMYSVGYLWKITGISWPVIDYFVAVLFALSTCFVFGLLRVVTGPWVSFAGALFFAVSPLQRAYLSQFRDYSKVPFLIASIFLLFVFVQGPLSKAKRFLLAIAVGVVVGIGYGFRGDLIVVVPFAVLVFFFLHPDGLKRNLLQRLGLILIFITGFVIVASPILQANGSMGSCTWHFILGGFADSFTETLGLQRSLYSWLFEANDRSIIFTALSYGERILGLPGMPVCSLNYDQASRAAGIQFFASFPADFYRRFLAVIPAVLNERDLFGLNLYVIFSAFFVLWLQSVRRALFFLFVVVYFCGYMFIQFQPRHYFYLELILWWSIACLIWSGWQLIRNRKWRASISSWQIKSFLAMLVLSFGLVELVKWSADLWQGQSLKNFTGKLEALPREALTLPSSPKGEDLRIDLGSFPFLQKSSGMSTELAVVNLNSEKCQQSEFNLKLEYNNDSPDFDLSRTIPLKLLSGEKSRHFYLPLYFHYNDYLKILSKPIALTVPASAKDCFVGIDRVVDRSSVPLWIDFSVPDNVQASDLRHKFRHKYFE